MSNRDGAPAWNTGFRDWLADSTFGKEEGAAKNNHGTFYDMQLAALAYATGDKDLARRTVLDARALRIDPQIAADGSQPQELARTRSWHYSTFDLVAYTRLAAIGRHVGVNLWSYEGPDGQSLFKAVGYLLPAATSAEPWAHPELEFHRFPRATSCTRPPTRGTGPRKPPCRSWKRRLAVTCGLCGPPRSSWTRSRADPPGGVS